MSVPRWMVRALVSCLLFLAAVATLWVAGQLLTRLMVVTAAVVAAVLLTALLEPLVRLLVRVRCPRWLAALLTLLLTLAAIGSVGFLLVERTLAQSDALRDALRESGRQLRDLVLRSPLPVDEAQLTKLPGQALDAVAGRLPSATSGAGMAVEVLSAFAVALFLWFFLLKDGAAMWRWFLSWVPRRRREVVGVVGGRTWDVLTRYVRGTVVIALADAIGTGIALVVLGVPLAVSLTLLVFLGAFVPIVGTTVAGAIAVAVTFVTVGAVQALLLLAAVLVVQQLEGNLLQPLVMGRALHLHPVTIVVAVTVGTLLAGVLGALVAVPVVAIGYRVAEDLAPRGRPRDEELRPAPERAVADG